MAVATAGYYGLIFAAYPPKPADGTESADTLTKVGQVAPDFEVTTLDGARLSLSRLRGKVVLLSFFATWCPPCQKELPILEKSVWSELKSDKFLMLAVAREQTESEVRTFQQQQGFTFEMATDPNRQAYAKYAAKGIPRVYLIAPDGTIAFQSLDYEQGDIARIKGVITKQLKKAR